MSDWIKKLKVKAILPAAALMAAAAIGTTFAWQTWDLSLTNELKSHTTVVDIEEDFDEDDPWKEKVVNIKNTGTSSAFLRVSYTEYWEKTNDSGERILLPNQIKNGNTNEDVAQKVLYERDPNNPEEYAKDSEGKNIELEMWDSAKWTFKDGWYYYNFVLESQDDTGEIISKVIKPSSEFYQSHPEYNGATYRLYFKAEVVQCSDGSNTLNSDIVNHKATKCVFEKMTATVDGKDVMWSEAGEGE